jgi:PST family polysaccharide transporter/teichuronic acid exporter
MQLQDSIIKGVKWTTLGTVGVAICSLLRLSILTRYLDKTDFGIMAIVLLVLGLLQLFMDMGLTSAIFHKQKVTKREYASLYWINLVFGIVVFALIFLIAPYIALFYEEPSLTTYIVIMASAVVFAGFGSQFKTIEQKRLNFKIIAIVDLTASILALGLAIVLAVFGYGMYALVFSALLQYALPNLFFFLRGIISAPVLRHFNFKEVKPFLKIGIFEVGSQFVNYFNRDIDIIIIGKLLGTEILGGYSLAKQLVYKPAQIINPIATKISNPVLAKFQDNLGALKKNYLELITIVSSLNFISYVGLILFAPWIVPIIYSNGSDSIVILVQILSVYMFIRSIGNPIGSLVIATGRTDVSFYWNLFSLAIMPIFIFTASQYGIQQVAWSLVAGFLFLFIPQWWFLVRKMTGASLKEFAWAAVPSIHVFRKFYKNKNVI